jgi:aryl-alcohol dehydrogenase-like predicted oxidoreductase
MEYRELGRTGWKISTISFGAWAIGGTWGEVDDSQSLAALHWALILLILPMSTGMDAVSV